MVRVPEFSLEDAEWLAHRHVEGADRIRFVHVPRREHRQFPFLTDEYLGQSRAWHDVPVADCLAAVPPAPLGIIFHSAFCGSTMLLAGLDRPGVAMGLSEPVLLNDIVGFRRRGAEPAAVARLADVATRLLARPFGAGEAVIVKPSNLLNPLARLIMALRGDAQALLLHAPLDQFLVSVVRKGLWCRLWVRELAEGYLTDRALDLGFTQQELFRQSDLQIAALGWLAQQALFVRLAAELGPSRVRSLDSERLASHPHQALAAAARHFRLTLPGEAIDGIVRGPVFTRHSKSGAAFDASQRKAEYAASRALHDDEIGKVLVWAEAVARANGLPMDLPGPLPV